MIRGSSAVSMAPVLLFIIGVSSGLVAAVLFGGMFPAGRGRDRERQLLEERLTRADEGLERFSHEMEAQRQELRQQQQEAAQAHEQAAISRVELEAVQRERDQLRAAQAEMQAAMERLGAQIATISQQLQAQEGQEGQAAFLEQMRAELRSQFTVLSAPLLEASRQAVQEVAQAVISKPLDRQVEQLAQLAATLQRDSSDRLAQLTQMTGQLQALSQSVQGTAQQLTSALDHREAKDNKQGATNVETARREAYFRQKIYELLETAVALISDIEDDGNQIIDAHNHYQNGLRSYQGGGQIGPLILAVIEFNNRWMQTKYRIGGLIQRRQALLDQAMDLRLSLPSQPSLNPEQPSDPSAPRDPSDPSQDDPGDPPALSALPE